MLAAASDEQTEAWVVALCKAGAEDDRQSHPNAWADVLLRDWADTARTAEAKQEYLTPEPLSLKPEPLKPEREQAPVLAPEAAHGQSGRGRGNPFDEVLRALPLLSTDPSPLLLLLPLPLLHTQCTLVHAA